MNAYIFPGQGAQYPGMGKDLYDGSEGARTLFQQANEILGFDITKTMFSGTEDELKETKVTQPAIFLHSCIMAKVAGNDFVPAMTAGHSLGEFSALVATGGLEFEDGVKLVSIRANAMQKACEANPSTMAAIMGMKDELVEEGCKEIEDIVVPANYNSPGQVVISGTNEGIDQAIEHLKNKGAKKAVKLNVGGAFHSPLMEPAREELAKAIESTKFSRPICPIYQNATATPETEPDRIQNNLIEQLTAPVKWTQSIVKMREDGAADFIEVGPGKVLQSLVKKIDRQANCESLIINFW